MDDSRRAALVRQLTDATGAAVTATTTRQLRLTVNWEDGMGLATMRTLLETVPGIWTPLPRARPADRLVNRLSWLPEHRFAPADVRLHRTLSAYRQAVNHLNWRHRGIPVDNHGDAREPADALIAVAARLLADQGANPVGGAALDADSALDAAALLIQP